MKKFLVFLVAIITTVCIGVTFYQFAKNDEVIKVDTQTIYINYGEKLSLDDIGFSRKEASKETKIDFNAGGEEVTSIIKYDELSGCYIPTSKGGSTTIKISTTNRKYKSFSIDVVVGIGTEEFPYYISNEKQLFEITNTHISEDACYELVNDITLTNPHTPIGYIDNKFYEFSGKFNGGYHTISNLNINTCDYAGLFAIVGANSQVYNLNVDKAVIEGSFINVGTIAGTCYGSINKVVVSNSTITNDKTSSNTGAVVGLLATDELYGTPASILRTHAYTNDNKLITANGFLGGLAGKIESAIIHACHTQLCLKNTSSAATGGLVGYVSVDENTYIRESYVVAQFESSGICGNVIGAVTLNSNTKLSDLTKELVLVGLYYDNTLNTFAGVGSDTDGFASSTNFAVNGKTTAEMKNKNTYIYYVNSSNNIVYWDKVWYLVDGEYPTLLFTNNFDDVIWDSENHPTTPDDNADPDISNPETPNSSATLISNKEQLLKAFQTTSSVNGNYILTSNIDLGGIKWTPVRFKGTFKSSDNHNYTISNFKIDENNSLYAGFFYDLGASTIKNITFNNITITSTSTLEAVGIVVGYIRGNVVISNVDVVNSRIYASAKYAGGIAGYIGNIVTKLELSDVNGLTFNGNALNVGGIAGYTSDNTYIISSKVKNSNTLIGIDRVGGIASVNRGTIYDCSFAGNIKSTSNATAGYFGGLTGVNYSTVTNSSAFAEIAVTNKTSNTSYFVGGLCGYNIGTLSNSSVYADEFSAKQSTNTVYLAGLAGYNAGKIEYCVADVLTIGSVDKNIYTAGLAVFNYGGKISGCFSFGNLNGYQVAGLVRTNTNNATIDSCMAALNHEEERATYKGSQIASFVYEISSGTISNSVVSANLNGTSDKGWIAGFAGFMPLTNNKYGTISHCIANVSLNGLGTKYVDITSTDLFTKKRTTGTINNSVISTDVEVDNALVSGHDKTFGKVQEAGSGSNYILVNNTKITNLDTYLNPTDCNFDISVGISTSKWLYVSGRIPLPRAYVEVFGYDIIGL